MKSTTKKKKDKLLLNLLEGEKHKHRVAMVNEEAEWNQHEPNSNMARMFVIMLLIHVIVIGGIIIYDWMNGEQAQNTVLVDEATPATMPSALSSASAIGSRPAVQNNPIPIEECATYEWRSGDSISSVAKKLGVTEEILIKMNMLDKGTQLEANSIIRYPKQPVVRAVGISVAGVNGELAKPAIPSESLAAAHQTMPLVAAGEQTFSFQPTLENELAPVPGTAPMLPAIQELPPVATVTEPVGNVAVKQQVPVVQEELPAAVPVMEQPVASLEEVKTTPKVQAKPEPVVENEVPKAIPVKRYTPPAIEKPAVKKMASTPAAKPASRSASYTVKPNDTLYSIANRHGVTVKALQTANKIARPESLRDGMKLAIPAK